MTGAVVLVRDLKEAGVPCIYTLCGNGLEPILTACRRGGMRVIDTRNEQAAAYMADTAGRLTRRPGVVATSSGVAHLNALTGVCNTWFDGSPMLLITGATDSATAGRGNFQDMDSVALSRPICKYAQGVNRVERISPDVREALRIALTGRMELGKIDFITPMVYWERAHRTHPFVPLVHEWADRVAYDRQVFPGLFVGLERKYGWSEIAAQVQETRAKGLPGVVFFAASSLEDSWDRLGVEEFPYWSFVPMMPWKDSTHPEPPRGLSLDVSQGIPTLRWQVAESDSALAYVVYRSLQGRIDPTSVTQILSVTGRADSSFVDQKPPAGGCFYVVSAVDRLGNESRISDIVTLSSVNVARR